MNGAAILDYGIELIDDDFGSNEYIIMNAAYREVLAFRPWTFLIKWDSSKTFSQYVTLPTDFVGTVADENGNGHLFVGDSDHKYVQIDIRDKQKYKNTNGFFYIDWANSRLVFTGSPADSGTVNLPYIYAPADITESTSPCPGFKEAFHPLISHKMAMIFYITEQEEKTRSYRPENAAEYQRLLDSMVLDDATAHEYAQNR